MRSLVLWIAMTLLVAGCGEKQEPLPAEPTASLEAGHIHGLGVDGPDGALFVATHLGLFRVTGGNPPEPVGEPRDLMGFTVAGRDRLLASGHPGAGQDEPANVGLVASADGGETWQPVSLAGETDFHVLEAAGETVYGGDATSGRLFVSRDGGRSWARRTPPAPLIDMAIDPRSPVRAVAATETGVFATRNAGRSWRQISGELTGLLAWPEPDALYLADFAGLLHRSRDGGRTFREVGTFGGEPAALVAQGRELHVALHDGQIRRSRDGGATWSTRATLEVPA